MAGVNQQTVTDLYALIIYLIKHTKKKETSPLQLNWVYRVAQNPFYQAVVFYDVSSGGDGSRLRYKCAVWIYPTA
jgi:hypothetical protein